MGLIEPACAFLREHAVLCGSRPDTVRTYCECLVDWLGYLERERQTWHSADGERLIAYRNAMKGALSPVTGQELRVSTVNDRVRCVRRFYKWLVNHRWLAASTIADAFSIDGPSGEYARGRRWPGARRDRDFFTLREVEALPHPLELRVARELLALLHPPFDLMARWQLHTGMRVGEMVPRRLTELPSVTRRTFEGALVTLQIVRKGGKQGQALATAGLIEETWSYVAIERRAAAARARKRDRSFQSDALFLTPTGRPVTRNWYQRVLSRAGTQLGIRVHSHQLRSTFACAVLQILEKAVHQGADINPLSVVQILLDHEHLGTTGRYLRALPIETTDLEEALLALTAATA
jgi:site-specific recombinase XerD